MSTLYFIAGMGAGAFTTATILLATIRLLSRDSRTRHEEMHAESLNELKQRNTLLAAQNAIFAALAKEEPTMPTAEAAAARTTL